MCTKRPRCHREVSRPTIKGYSLLLNKQYASRLGSMMPQRQVLHTKKLHYHPTRTFPGPYILFPVIHHLFSLQGVNHVPHQHPRSAFQSHGLPQRFIHRSDPGHAQGQMVGFRVLPGRLHLRLSNRAGRSGRQLRRIPETRRRNLQRIHRHALHPQGLARHLRHYPENPFPHAGRPHGRAQPQLPGHD